MSVDNEGDFVPRAPRFKVAGSDEVRVTITRTDQSDPTSFTAELVDVSQHGTKLRVPVNLSFEESLQIAIEVPGSELEYHGVASVRHIRGANQEHNEERWLVGCAIAPALSDETFAFLATTAGTERRRFRRLNIAAEAMVRRQTQTVGSAAALHNLSSGGFCFSSPDHYEVGERVQLAIDGTDGELRVINAQICWQVDSPDGSFAGCKFVSKSSYAELCACVIDKPSRSGSMVPSEAPTSKLVLTAAVLAMFVPPMMTLMMQAKKVVAKAPLAARLSTTAVGKLADLEPQESKPVDCESADSDSTDSDPTVVAASDRSEIKRSAQAGQAEVNESHGREATAVAVESAVAVAHDLSAEGSLVQDSLGHKSRIRDWVDNTGKYRTRAQLLEISDQHVVLLKANGKTSKVPWGRLSEADQQFARDWPARQL